MNRSHRLLKCLFAAPNKTLSLFELRTLLNTDWPPRAVNEARKISGVIIEGDNPYKLTAWPDWLAPHEVTFDNRRNMAKIAPKENSELLKLPSRFQTTIFA